MSPAQSSTTISTPYSFQRNRSLRDSILLLPPSKRQQVMDQFPIEEIASLEYAWRGYTARPNQLRPGTAGAENRRSNWRFWVCNAGRGWGKTRTGAETVREWAEDKNARIMLIAPTANDVREVMMEGPGGLMSCYPPADRPEYIPFRGLIQFKSGAIGITKSAEDPERLRGFQFTKFWADELCAWSYPQESWDQIMFGFRLKSDDLQGLITTTPKPLPTYKKILKDPRTVISRGSSYENKTNLSSEFFDTILARYENTRLGRQEINAEILEDVEGALWNRSMLDDHRVMLRDVPPLLRIVVAIDPAVSALESSDETGIIIAGIAANGHCYVLEDRSGKYSPADWVCQAVQGWAQYRADRIVAEVNNGGDLVEMAVRSFPGSGGCIPFTKIHSTRGKAKRAEPVAALYERGRVHHVLPANQFSVLEDQLVSFVPGVETGTKDDRLDALCFGICELAISPTPLEGRVVSSDRVSISRF